MKLLVLTSRFPYPIEKGDKLRVYHQLRWLAQEHEVSLIALSDHEIDPQDLAHLEEMLDQVYVFRLRKVDIVWQVLLALLRGKPIQQAYFYRSRIHKAIQELIQTLKPDHIYCQLLRMAAYLKDEATPSTIDYMDAFSVGMARQAEAESWWKAPLFRRESRLLSQYEQTVYPYFQQHTLISQQDFGLMTLGEERPVTIIPNGIDADYFAPIRPHQPAYDLTFVGNLGYFPNIKAAQYLVQQVMPLVWEVRPETSLLLAGARPHAQVKALASQRVVLSGWLDDIREGYAAGKVFVAPIFTGSGQQNKMLEAMAMGMPCLTTTLVNNAIGAHKEMVAVADTPTAFAQHLLQLLDDPTRRESMGQQARTFVQQQFSWSATVAHLSQLMENRQS